MNYMGQSPNFWVALRQSRQSCKSASIRDAAIFYPVIRVVSEWWFNAVKVIQVTSEVATVVPGQRSKVKLKERNEHPMPGSDSIFSP